MSKIEQPQDLAGLKRASYHYAIRQPSESRIKVLNGSLMSLTKGRYPTAHRRRSSLDASVIEGSGPGKTKEFRLLKEGRICKQNSSELVRSQKNEISKDSPDFSIFRTDDLRRRVLQSTQDPLLASMKASHQYKIEIGQKFNQKEGMMGGQYQHVQKHKPLIKHSTDSLPDSYEVGSHPKLQVSSEKQAHLKNSYAKLRTTTAEGSVKQRVVMMFPLVIKKQKKKKQQPSNQLEQQSDMQKARVMAGDGTSPKQFSQTTKTTEVFKNSGGRFAHWVQPDCFNEKNSSNGAEGLQFESSPPVGDNKVRFAIAINGQLECWKEIPILKKDSELLSRIETHYGKSTAIVSRNWYDQSQSREADRIPYHSDLHVEKGQLEMT